MNNVQLIGRLTGEVEKHTFAPTSSVCARCTLALKGKGTTIDDKPITYFFKIEAWGDLGKALFDKCQKGDKIAVSGYLKYETFTRKDGTQGDAVKVVATSIDFLFPPREPKPVEEVIDVPF